jgi:aryl-alcohol dehydrogenase-like predicted oxidoreductase
MATAWVLSRPFLGASILGATDTAQVTLALGAADLTLGPEVLAEIAAAHKAHPLPY